ncbi:MAG: DUF2493 domain-containing protein [Kordiimonadaceae bacterium]|nr:DUF2493 domain-containing protein [Kordiimonadaceae bacterium]
MFNVMQDGSEIIDPLTVPLVTDDLEIQGQSATGEFCDYIAQYGMNNHELATNEAPEHVLIGKHLVGFMEALQEEMEGTAAHDSLKYILHSIVGTFARQANMASNNATKAASQLADAGKHQGSQAYTNPAYGHGDQIIEDLTDTFEKSKALSIAFEQVALEGASAYYTITQEDFRPRTSGGEVRSMPYGVYEAKKYLEGRKVSSKGSRVNPDTAKHVVVTGGPQFGDARTVFTWLDKLNIQYPELVLVTTGRDCPLQAAIDNWAKTKSEGVHVQKVQPDWRIKSNSKFTRRNNDIFDACPDGMIVFPHLARDSEPQQLVKVATRHWKDEADKHILRAKVCA